LNAEQRLLTDHLPMPPGQLSRPAPLAVAGTRNVRQVLRDLCAGVRRECVMMHDQTAAREAGVLLPVASWPGVEVRALNGVVLARYLVPARPAGRSEAGANGAAGANRAAATNGAAPTNGAAAANGAGPSNGAPNGATGANGAYRGRRMVPMPDQGPLRLVLVDRSAALVPLRPGSTFEGGVLLVRDPAITGSLHTMCATLWRHARPLPPRHDGPPPALLPVLDALLEGLTDVAAAKRLGVSPRTYSRRVAELLGVLGISSRTQVGAAALAKGWIASGPS